MQNKYKRLGKNTLIVFIGNIGSKLISFIMLPFYTRWLSVEDYGVMDLVNSYATLFLGIVSCSIVESVFIFPKNANRDDQSKYFTTALYFCAIMIAASGVLFCFLNDPSGGNTLRCHSIAIWGILSSSLLQSVTQQFARSIDKMFIFGTTGIVQALSVFCLSVYFIPSHGLNGYILSIIFANIVTAFFALLLSKGYQYFRFGAWSGAKLKEMLKYSIPLIPNAIMFWVIGTLNRPLMETYCGLHTLGLYAIAMKIASIVSVASSIFFSSWQISVLEEFGKKTYSDFYNKVMNFIYVGMILLFFIVSIISPILLKLLTTPDFYEANRYVPLLILGTLLSAFASCVAANFSAAKASKYFLYSSLLSAMFAIILNFILIPQLGIMGALIAYVCSFIVMVVSRIYYSWKYVRIRKIKLYVILFCIASLYCVCSYIHYNDSLPLIFAITMSMTLGVFILFQIRKWWLSKKQI